MKSKIIALSVLVLGFVLGATALSALAEWTAPACNPATDPGACNTPAPLNVGTLLQTKKGPLSINTNAIENIGLSVAGAIKIAHESAGAGKVLTSDANGVGTWQNIASAGGANITFIAPVSISVGNNPTMTWATYAGGVVPAGAKAVILEATFDSLWGRSEKVASVQIRKDASSATLRLINLGSAVWAANENRILGSNQGIFPVAADGTFQYAAHALNGTLDLKIIGYIEAGGSSGSSAGQAVGGYTEDCLASGGHLQCSVTNTWGVAVGASCPVAYNKVQTARSLGASYSWSFLCLTK